VFRLGKALGRYIRSGGEIGALPNYHQAYQLSRMLQSMEIYVDPKTLAEEWDSYWLNSILVEYDLQHDPQIQAYYQKQQEKAEREKEREQERAASRQRAGDNHLHSVGDQDS
jgi:hypothetical protein